MSIPAEGCARVASLCSEELQDQRCRLSSKSLSCSLVLLRVLENNANAIPMGTSICNPFITPIYPIILQ